MNADDFYQKTVFVWNFMSQKILLAIKKAADAKQWLQVPDLTEQLLAQSAPIEHALHLSRVAKLYADANLLDDALRLFQRALAASQRDADTMQIHGWIADFASNQASYYDVAAHHAKLSLAMRDQLSESHRALKKMVAFSLYGKLPAYCETLILNAQAMPRIYPDWHMRVYHDHTVPNHVLHRLRAHGVECVDVASINASHIPGTFWRFLALEDWAYDVVLMRDADSIVNEREKKLVDAWLASDKPFHVMRDWYSHSDVILAGLWGARGGFLGDIRARIEHYLRHENVHPTHGDQFFLAQHIWQRIKPYCLHHSSVIEFEGAQWVEDLSRIHINEQNQVFQLGSWQLSHIAPQTTQPYFVYLVHVTLNGTEQIFCEYAFQAGETFELPKQYWEDIKTGRKKIIFSYTQKPYIFSEPT